MYSTEPVVEQFVFFAITSLLLWGAAFQFFLEMFGNVCMSFQEFKVLKSPHATISFCMYKRA